MTANQIAYYKAEQDAIAKREANRIAEQQFFEQRRANRRKEEQNDAQLEELARSNKAKENLGYFQTNANVSLGYSNLSEATRHNRASETEQNRANLAMEGWRQYTADEARRANIARETDADLARFETNRSNLAREIESHRANVARENETNRANLAQELQKRAEFSANNVWNAINAGLKAWNILAGAE